jgi:hypothetical protein
MNKIQSLVLVILMALQSTSAFSLNLDETLELEGIEATSAENFVCSLDNLAEAKRWIESQQNHYDKFKHCAVSCYLSLRCRPAEVMLVGLAKEFQDLFGKGNAEIADLRADRAGIRLVTSGRAQDDAGCVQQCNQIYPLPLQ